MNVPTSTGSTELEKPRPLRDRVGVVAIGRNEGDRLKGCLGSLNTVTGEQVRSVYVDSGSTDGSLEMAGSMGVLTEELNISVPFTAARARNAGFARLVGAFPELEYVQFIDGDCEMLEGWIEAGVGFLDTHENAAVVCGNRRERYPDQSIYNLLCDMEWGGPIGEVKACGGDALMRVPAFLTVGGFRADLIAGEEPELCVRLRQSGWQVFRLDVEMCLHDAAMTRFSQWWKRSARAGHAFAEGACIHGRPPEWHCVRPLVSSLTWGFFLPVVVLLSTLAGHIYALALLALYPIQVFRIARRGDRRATGNWINALFLVVSKFSEFSGNARFAINRLRRGPARLIEYK